ncbi:hypothetical protein C8F04DRAFT_1263588 [Mycena alexandri]|uniref:Uncharacterized protein n=1 Tax=Mycena alexandri TaxID=1745969 RepID=A0AAD6SQL7_9AGAR|nr:hypothetical protein C8F04DRAFT_1263588 [Mycena alexandri]
MIPDVLNALAAPPTDFVPCFVPEHLGDNFLSHAHFSSRRNKTYWLLMGPLREGVYSLKVDCMRAKAQLGLTQESAVAVASLDVWSDVVALWAKYCFHRHRKCVSHPTACVRGCPTHSRQVVAETLRNLQRGATVKEEIAVKKENTKKEEGGVSSRPTVKQEWSPAVKLEASPAVKRESGRMATKRKAELQSPSVPDTLPRRGRRRPPRARKAPILSYTGSTSADDDGSVDSDFFFLPDSPTPSERKKAAAAATSGGDNNAAATVAEDGGIASASGPPTRATSPTMSSASSLSVSSFPAPNADAKGKQRAQSNMASSASRHERASTAMTDGAAPNEESISRAPLPNVSRAPVPVVPVSRADPSAAVSSISRAAVDQRDREQGPSRGDIFYVSARGAVHHSRTRAFADIQAGPLQPVVGYDAAMTYADNLVRNGGGAKRDEPEA